MNAPFLLRTVASALTTLTSALNVGCSSCAMTRGECTASRVVRRASHGRPDRPPQAEGLPHVIASSRARGRWPGLACARRVSNCTWPRACPTSSHPPGLGAVGQVWHALEEFRIVLGVDLIIDVPGRLTNAADRHDARRQQDAVELAVALQPVIILDLGLLAANRRRQDPLG